MTKAEQKRLERIHILRTIYNYDTPCGMRGVSIADLANEACDHDLLEGLPPISRRAIGQKLQAMSIDGLVVGEMPRDWRSLPLSERRTLLWRITDKGRDLACSIDGPRQDQEVER